VSGFGRFVMEQILPGVEPDNWDYDPIERNRLGDFQPGNRRWAATPLVAGKLVARFGAAPDRIEPTAWHLGL
jgi:hypothetical protein